MGQGLSVCETSAAACSGVPAADEEHVCYGAEGSRQGSGIEHCAAKEEAHIGDSSGGSKGGSLPGFEKAQAALQAAHSSTGTTTPLSHGLAHQITETPVSVLSAGDSASSIASRVKDVVFMKRERRRSEAHVWKFLKAHGFSSVNHLRRDSFFSRGRPQRPLHAAVAVGDAQMVRLLLLHGADPMLQDTAGHRADEVSRWRLAPRCNPRGQEEVCFETWQYCGRGEFEGQISPSCSRTSSVGGAAGKGWHRYRSCRLGRLLRRPQARPATRCFVAEPVTPPRSLCWHVQAARCTGSMALDTGRVIIIPF